MTTPSLRARLGAGPTLRGPFLGIPSPATVEIVCAAGPDFVCIDGEHSPIRGELLINMLRAAELWRVPALVRVPDGLPSLIAEVLDAGATGILVPRVSTAEQALLAVQSARFPATGRRGVGPGRAAGYGYGIGGYVTRAEAETLVAVQIETIEGVANIAAILAVPGIDLAFIGPGDLGFCLGAAGAAMPGALDAAIEDVVGAAETAGIPVGIFAPDRTAAERWIGRLALVIQGSDGMLLAAAAAAGFAKPA